ncbi:hypothetical protein [Geminocystis sp. GBBB08]|nr:hypothetical protein [Geminocystis sp. GBBB08]
MNKINLLKLVLDLTKDDNKSISLAELLISRHRDEKLYFFTIINYF